MKFPTHQMYFPLFLQKELLCNVLVEDFIRGQHSYIIHSCEPRCKHSVNCREANITFTAFVLWVSSNISRCSQKGLTEPYLVQIRSLSFAFLIRTNFKGKSNLTAKLALPEQIQEHQATSPVSLHTRFAI